MSQERLMHTRTPLILVAALVASLAAFGCGDDPHGDPHDGDADRHTGEGACGNVDNCVDTVDIEAGLATEGEAGAFTLTVDAHNTLSPEDNEWTVTLTRADGAGDPVANAKLTVDVWSVDCMHGGPLPPDEITTDADGKAKLHPVTLHGGPWDVVVKVKAGSASDTITLHLCIPGHGHGATDPDAEDDAG